MKRSYIPILLTAIVIGIITFLLVSDSFQTDRSQAGNYMQRHIPDPHPLHIVTKRSPANPAQTSRSPSMSRATTPNHPQELYQEPNQNRQDWFSDNFFTHHHHQPKHQPEYYNQGDNCWNTPSWDGVATWVPYGWDDTGNDEDQPQNVITPQEPLQNAPTQEPPTQSEWMPLGVFAAGQSPQAASFSTMFVQIALNKNGKISGTYYNTATDEVHDITGEVNQYTQEASWKISDLPDSPIMTTTIYNLTQDTAIVEVHFPNNTIQNWTFVRQNK